MLHLVVTIPATVPQGSELQEGLMNYSSVYSFTVNGTVRDMTVPLRFRRLCLRDRGCNNPGNVGSIYCFREICLGGRDATLSVFWTDNTRRTLGLHPVWLVIWRKMSLCVYLFWLSVSHVYSQVSVDSFFRQFERHSYLRVTVFVKCVCDVCAILEDQLTDLASIWRKFHPQWISLSCGGKCGIYPSKIFKREISCHVKTRVYTELKRSKMYIYIYIGLSMFAYVFKCTLVYYMFSFHLLILIKACHESM
jgi:hypothetical protein